MRERYTDDHPDVVQLKTRIQTQRALRADLQKKEEAQEKEAAAEREKRAKVAAGQPKRVDPGTARELQSIQSQMEQQAALIRAKEMEIDDLHKEQRRIDAMMKERRAVLTSTPINGGEYAILMQDAEQARKRYDDLNSKFAQSEVATEVENRKQGETLELLDAASLPLTPIAPKRWLIIGVGVALGAMLGLSLAGVREMKDTSLKNLKDVRAYTQLQILASVPLLENDLVVRRRRRLIWLAWSTACLFGIAIMSGSVLYYFTNKG